MTEHEQEPRDDEQGTEGAADEASPVAGGDRDDALSPAEDANNPGLISDEQHESAATDLPEGATIDPLTDQRPEPVVEQETHDD